MTRTDFLGWAAMLAVAAALPASARADYMEGFDSGTNYGKWILTTNKSRELTVMPSGGNPGAYLYGTVSTAVPTWFVPAGAHSPFLGNYQIRKVSGMSIDLNVIVQANDVPFRNLTLDLQSTFGTGDPTQGVKAWYVSDDTNKNIGQWNRYRYPVDSLSSSVPPGWTILRGDGSPGDGSDWQRLMQNVETLGFMMGIPGYFYPDLNIWTLGIDNVSILTNGAN